MSANDMPTQSAEASPTRGVASVIRMIGRRIVLPGALMLALLAGVFGVQLASPSGSVTAPQQASAGVLDLVVANKKHPTDADKYNKVLNICKDWNYPKGVWKARTCKDSETGTLLNGQNSKTKYGWADTDAVYIPGKYKLMLSVAGPDIAVQYNNDSSGYYYKFQPPPTKQTYWLKKI